MRRFFEYGLFSAAILCLVYFLVALFTGVAITITTLLLCVAGSILSGLLVAVLLIIFSPGKHIKEGEEDHYIRR